MTHGLPDGSRLGFGVASAAYQVEGAPAADGKGPSIWDTLTRVPGAIDDGSDGSIACASYPDPGPDLDLVAGLGVGHYRFSIAWPRIVPCGDGVVNSTASDYYDRLVDGLLERGVDPMVTLYHWDLPQALEDAGGWLVRDTAERFADYAMVVHDHLADRVRIWATLNEPWCSAYLGYGSGRHAPGRQVGGDAHRAAHHLLLAHGLAAGRMRAAGADTVGIVLNLTPVWPDAPRRRRGGRRGRRHPQPGLARPPRRRGVRRGHAARRPGPGATPSSCGPATSSWCAARPTGWGSTTTRPRAWTCQSPASDAAVDSEGTPTWRPSPASRASGSRPRHPRSAIDWEIEPTRPGGAAGRRPTSAPACR